MTWGEFLRTSPPLASGSSAVAVAFPAGSGEASAVSKTAPPPGRESRSRVVSSTDVEEARRVADQVRAAAADPGVPFMRPLLISKVNTVFQITLLSGCMGRAWVEWPDPESLVALEVVTAGTTAASCAAYAYRFVYPDRLRNHRSHGVL